jgi:outer membrane receptor for ferrienterochelin and colicins
MLPRNLILFLIVCPVFFPVLSTAQGKIKGTIQSGNGVIASATVRLMPVKLTTVADSMGNFSFDSIPAGNYSLKVSMIGYEDYSERFILKAKEQLFKAIQLKGKEKNIEEVVVTGTLKEARKTESTVPVEVYTPAFFRRNPTPSVFDALQNVNGVRPQLNCNICSTGDIHINGLEGPYTMVLIDGMPIVSSLATVYGLSGIPNSMVERIEVVKGPASSLYGSEAVGGLINIITKKTVNAPLVFADIMMTSWKEYNTDISFKLKTGKQSAVLTGINFFNFNNRIDNNNDFFTDVTQQKRISIFQKWNFNRQSGKVMNLAGRYLYENRWGGDVRWKPAFRGGDSIYGESIYTKRVELLGNYELPVPGKMLLSFSYTAHLQDSRYGKTVYDASQHIGFTQLTYDFKKGNHDLLAGMALRYTIYDDNTVATASADSFHLTNKPDKTWLPGIFLQDEWSLNKQHKILMGLRYDHHPVHGSIFTPRIGYKWNTGPTSILRLNAGTGFRVVNLFTEDHAALTGARSVEIRNSLKPEKSFNINLTYTRKIHTASGNYFNLDFTSWYTRFQNRIVADYESHPDKIIYDNLSGHAISKGISVNFDMALRNGLKVNTGATFMNVYTVERNIKKQQLLTEKFTGTWTISYPIRKLKMNIDYTGNIYGPMRLPLLGKLDPRQPYSPVWSIQNIQLQFTGIRNVEIYAGIKNLLNWTPARSNPFLIARTHDPFDKQVQYDAAGNILATPDNPYALSFDPTYVYAPNQGIRGFAGIRLTLK